MLVDAAIPDRDAKIGPAPVVVEVLPNCPPSKQHFELTFESADRGNLICDPGDVGSQARRALLRPIADGNRDRPRSSRRRYHHCAKAGALQLSFVARARC